MTPVRETPAAERELETDRDYDTGTDTDTDTDTDIDADTDTDTDADTEGTHEGELADTAEAVVECMDPGEGYLVLEPKPKRTFEIFTSLDRRQYQGLIVTRTYPDKIRERYGLKVTPMVWLSVKERSENNLGPTNLGMLAWVVKEFLEKSENGMVLLDGFEYLTINNGSTTVSNISSISSRRSTSISWSATRSS